VVAGATTEGGVVLFEKDCRIRRKIDGVHGFPISSAVCIGGCVVTGGLDAGVVLTPIPPPRKVSIWIWPALVVLLLAALLGFSARSK
jgi:hypothetical protein